MEKDGDEKTMSICLFFQHNNFPLHLLNNPVSVTALWLFMVHPNRNW